MITCSTIILVLLVAGVWIYGGANVIGWYDQGRPRGEPWNWRVLFGYRIYHRWYRKEPEDRIRSKLVIVGGIVRCIQCYEPVRADGTITHKSACAEYRRDQDGRKGQNAPRK